MANVARYLTGYEGWPTGTISSVGGGLSSAVGGTPTIGTAYKRSGAQGCQCNLVAGADESFNSPTWTGQAVSAVSIWINVQAYQAGQVGSFCQMSASTGNAGIVGHDASGNWAFNWTGNAISSTGPAITTNVWHLIELLVDMHVNPWTAKWRVDGVDQSTPATYAVALNTGNKFGMGYYGTAPTKTGEIWFDDLVIIDGTDQTMWPPGSFVVEGITADQTAAAEHQGSLNGWLYTDNNFTGTTGITTASETASRSRIDDLGGTDGVENNVTAAGGNLRYPVADPVNTGVPRAVSLITASKESATGTSNATFRTFIPTATTNHFSGDPGWGTTLTFLSTCMDQRPGTGAWSLGYVQNIRFEFASTDGVPNPQLMGFVYEVAFSQVIYTKSGYAKEGA